MALLCPWGRSTPDLSQKVITLDQKQWFIQEIVSKKTTSKMLANKFNLNENRIKGWVRKVKKGVNLSESVGRPLAVNACCTLALESFAMDRRNYSSVDFKPNLICEVEHQFALSNKRRIGDSSEFLAAKVPSNATKRRYIKHLLHLHEKL